ELVTRLPVQCGELSPSGSQIALGCTDGQVHLVAVDGFDSSPLLVTPTQTSRETTGVIQRLFGKRRVTTAFACLCPACRKSFELPGTRPGQGAPCPHCHRNLRLSSFIRMSDPVPTPSR